MMSRTVALFLFFTCAASVFAQTVEQQLSNMDAMIQHFRNVESTQGKLLDDLNRGVVVMVRMHDWEEPIPMRTADLRDYVVSLAITAELGRDKPDVAAAEQRAQARASKFIIGCKANVEKKKADLAKELSQVRTNRQKMERARERLRQLSRPDEPKPGNFTGHWNSSVGRFAYPRDLNLSQYGYDVTGTWTHRTGQGTIKGTVRGNVLTFTYTEQWASNGQSGTDKGTGTFTLSRDGKSFSGTYTSDLPEGDKGNGWRGTKAEG